MLSRSAERHLEKAKEFVSKGDEYYREAGLEIRLARAQDATWAEISRFMGKGVNWVQDVANMPENRTTPEWRRGSHATAKEIEAGAKKLLSKDPSKLLEDPAVVAAIAESPEATATLMRAARAVGDRVEETESGRFAESNPSFARADRLLTILTRLANARSAVVKSFEELQDMVLTEDEGEKVLRFAQYNEGAAVLLVAFLTGESVDFDELLAEEV